MLSAGALAEAVVQPGLGMEQLLINAGEGPVAHQQVTQVSDGAPVRLFAKCLVGEGEPPRLLALFSRNRVRFQSEQVSVITGIRTRRQVGQQRPDLGAGKPRQGGLWMRHRDQCLDKREQWSMDLPTAVIEDALELVGQCATATEPPAEQVAL